MGKLKKNQPGYTQGKDKNGRTIWVPDGSAQNTHSASGGSQAAASDFSEPALSNERIEEARDNVMNHVDFLIDNKGYDSWGDNPNLQKPLREIVEQIGDRYAEDLKNNPGLLNTRLEDAPFLYDDIDVVLNYTPTGDVFADSSNATFINELSRERINMNAESKEARINVKELFAGEYSTERTHASQVFSDLVEGDYFNTAHIMSDSAYHQERYKAVDDAMKRADIKDAVNKQGGDTFEWNQKIGYIPVQLEILSNDDKYINRETGDIDVDSALNALMEKHGAVR